MAQNPFKKIWGFFKRAFSPTPTEPTRPRDREEDRPPITPRPPAPAPPRNEPEDPGTLPPITPRPSEPTRPTPTPPSPRPDTRPTPSRPIRPVPNPAPPPRPVEPTPTPDPTPAPAPPRNRPSPTVDPLPPPEFSPITSLLSEARRYLDTPYLFGGTDPATGFDCSGFLDYVYTRKGFSLPRTSREQAQAGREIPKDAARPGDLVYFTHDGDTVQHIGMVISEPGEDLAMIHASSSQGVTETNVDASSYWSPRMLGVRRVIG